ncbi:hypothetical protein RCL1_006398 [Eukaryota sp. TZLM3-RCL]
MMEDGLEPLEKVADYTAKFMALKKRLKVEVAEGFLVAKFVERIYPQEVKRAINLRVQAGLLSTISEVAKDLIEEMERYYAYRPRPNPDQKTPNHYYPQSERTKPQSENRQPIKNDENRTCSHCKRKGHLVEKCWLLHPHLKQSGSTTGRRTINLIQNKPPIDSVRFTNHSSNSDLFTVPLIISGKEFQGIVDSGASISCITRDIVESCNLTLVADKKEFFTADQRRTWSLGKVLASLTMKNIMPSSKLDFNAEFMVIEGQNQILIGRDILRRLGLMTDNSMVIHVNNSNSSQEIDDCFDHLNLPLIAESTCEPHSNDWKDCIKFQLDDTDKDQILKTLEKFPEVWSSQFPEDGIVCAPMPIEFTDESKVVCFPPRPLCPRKLKIANEYFDDLIARKIARESTSSFRSPIVLIEYENKKPRIAGDYSGAKGINSLTKTIPASLPRLSDVHEVLAKANYICLIDLPQAFYQGLSNCEKKILPKQLLVYPEDALNLLEPRLALRMSRLTSNR